MGLLRVLEGSRRVRKLFGKRELVIIKKQLLGVNLTQSEKNRLSRDIREKLKAIRETGQFASEFELKKGVEIKRIIEETKNIILESKWFGRIKRIVLFGSAAENTLTLSSDIDICIEFSHIAPVDAGRFRREILGRVSERMDVQVYNLLSGKLKKEIDGKGRVIYERARFGQDKRAK